MVHVSRSVVYHSRCPSLDFRGAELLSRAVGFKSEAPTAEEKVLHSPKRPILTRFIECWSRRSGGIKNTQSAAMLLTRPQGWLHSKTYRQWLITLLFCAFFVLQTPKYRTFDCSLGHCVQRGMHRDVPDLGCNNNFMKIPPVFLTAADFCTCCLKERQVSD